MKKETRDNQKLNVWRGLFAFLVFAAVLFRLHYVKVPASSSSEIPYWNFILKLAGKRELFAENIMSYPISFGYCLPFSLLIRYGVSFLKVYKLALAVNGAALAMIYYKSEKIAFLLCAPKKEKLSVRDRMKINICLTAVILLPVFYSQAFLLGPQMILAFLILLTVEFTAHLEDKQENRQEDRNRSFTSILCILLIGILISPLFLTAAAGWCIGMCIYIKKNHRYQKEFFKTGIYLVIGIMVLEIIQYIGMMFLQSDSFLLAASGISSLLQRCSDGLAKEGILGLLFGVIGEGVYLFVNTFGLMFFGIYVIYQNSKKGENLFLFIPITWMFFMNTCLAAFLNAANGNAGLPQDSMISMTAFLVMIPGVYYVLKKRYTGRDMIKIGIAAGILALLCKDVWRWKGLVELDWSSSGILSIGRELVNNSYQLPVLGMTAAGMLIAGICLWGKYTDQTIIRRLPRRLFTLAWGIAGIAMMIVIFLSDTLYVKRTLSYVQDKYIFSYEAIGKILASTDRPIYYYGSVDNNNEAALVKLWTPDTSMVTITQEEELKALPENAVLVLNPAEEREPEVLKEYQQQYETDKLAIWEKKKYAAKSELTQVLIGETIKLPEIRSRDPLRSTYGARTTWSSGKYKAKIKLTILTEKQKELGVIKIVSGSDVVAAVRIKGNGKMEEQQTIKLPFKSAADMENFRIAIQTENIGKIEIDEVNVTKIGDYTNAKKGK